MKKLLFTVRIIVLTPILLFTLVGHILVALLSPYGWNRSEGDL